MSSFGVREKVVKLYSLNLALLQKVGLQRTEFHPDEHQQDTCRHAVAVLVLQ